MQTGTRVREVTHDTVLLAWKPSALPTGVPVVTGVPEGLLKLLAEKIAEKFDKWSVMTRDDSLAFGKLIQEGKPTEAYHGHWEDGKSPCDLLN
jgi:hypothetical protein